MNQQSFVEKNKMAKFDNFVSLDLGQLDADESRFDKRAPAPRINKFSVPVDEERVIRILRSPSDPTFYSVRAQHWNLPGEGRSKRPYSCSKKHTGEPCYFCEKVNDLYNSGSPEDLVIAKGAKASVTVVMNVLDVKNPTKEDGTPNVMLWTPSWRTFQEIRNYFRDPEYGDLTHPVKGRNFRVARVSQANTTWSTYQVRVSARESELEVPEALDHLYDLEETLPVKLYSYGDQRLIWEDPNYDPRSDMGLPASAASVAPKIEAPTPVEEEFEAPKATEEVFEAASSEDDEWDDVVSDDDSSEKQSDMQAKLAALKKAAKK
jgi:hypothetical protein